MYSIYKHFKRLFYKIIYWLLHKCYEFSKIFKQSFLVS